MTIGRCCGTADGRTMARAFELALGGVAMEMWLGRHLRRLTGRSASAALGLSPVRTISSVLGEN